MRNTQHTSHQGDHQSALTLIARRYHATNESYKYLNNFFIGTLDAQDAHLVPPPRTPPSEAFIATLRSFLAKESPATP